MKPINRKSGFTIIELLVALSITTLVILMVSMVFAQGLKYTRMISGEARLVDATAQFTNFLTYQIRPATELNEISPTELEITHPNFSVSTFELVGNELQYNGVSVLSDKIAVDYIDFAVIESTVQVSFQFSTDVGAIAGYEIEPLAGITTISTRN